MLNIIFIPLISILNSFITFFKLKSIFTNEYYLELSILTSKNRKTLYILMTNYNYTLEMVIYHG